MKRKIINIDREKCNGCGVCVSACHESAIILEDGKAKLVRNDYCDGLGDCIPTCEAGAITIIEKDVEAYNDEAVKQNQLVNKEKNMSRGCLSSAEKVINCDQKKPIEINDSSKINELRQWPVQIKLVPTNAKYFDGANLLIAADCVAYAYGNFHQEFMRNHITLIGCPKLDMIDYADKLCEIIKNNNIKSIKIVKMEVPCCGGIENAIKKAMLNSGKLIPWSIFTISTDGNILN